MTDLPPDVELVRTTPEFDERSVPAGLLRTHRVAPGVIGRIRVTDGALTLVFEDDGELIPGPAGAAIVIPPDRPHHLRISAPVRFLVEFHR